MHITGPSAAAATLDCCPLPVDVATTLSSALHVMASMVAQCHAQVCVIAVRAPSGEVITELAHRESDLEEVARELLLGAHEDDRLHVLRSVMKSGSAVAVPGPALWLDAAPRDLRAQHMSATARRSTWVVVPLKCNDAVIGGLQLLHTPMTLAQALAGLGRSVALGDSLAPFLAQLTACAAEPDAVRTRDHMLALVAHDLRNPLNVIKMSTELMLERLPTEEPFFRRWLGATILATDRMTQIVGDLLEVSRIEAGESALRPARVLLDSLLREAVMLFSFQAEQSGIRLELEPVPPDAYVNVDVEAVQHVLSNLLDNALRFTPAAGKILIRADRDGEKFRVQVADTGSGIEPEHLPHIFDRFYQAKSSHRAGAGLGLAIAKGIVEAHGGHICATSTPGAGTTFYFTLPAAD